MLFEPMFYASVLAGTCLTAVMAWWHDPRLRGASLGVLMSAAVIVLSVPVIHVIHAGVKASSFDPVGDGFEEFAEFIVIGGFLGLVHLASLGVIGLLSVEKFLVQRKAARKLGVSDEIPGND